LFINKVSGVFGNLFHTSPKMKRFLHRRVIQTLVEHSTANPEPYCKFVNVQMTA
jgi:hypothetical protein